ncbi:TIGR02679 family protein [Bacillus carboniphilus]|uniref:TIGR02679 family protein n=1 Tax=Bacillus carboniphilus TaxID=86663 RepID=A0ABY9JTC3_9BACI|nr:TIGR02679 family protein [Bacillus carboniphilus]WLR42639.1 TIGR02679 family protein [Bacillus carboniphilus]
MKVDLFKKEPGFKKLFLLFKDKYRSLGRVGGTVSLESFDEVEVESIAGFLGQSPDVLRKKGKLALADFEKELMNTGFVDWTLVSLLEQVLGETIYTKKQQLEMEQRREEKFFKALLDKIPSAEGWIDQMKAKTPDTRWIWTLYKQDQEALMEKMIAVYQAFLSLPEEGTFEHLPFFSQRTTGNPHYFDRQEVAGRLLCHCLYVDQLLQGNLDRVMPKSGEEINDLLAEYGILRDDLWNFVTCQGLVAAIGDHPHPVWQAACDTSTVLNVPMKELVKIDRVWPTRGDKVWIVENSSVASTIMNELPDAPIICTHGQFRAASWRLLHLLVQSNCTLYYSGDLDPEGVLIAERLKRRFHDHVVLWRMDHQSYRKSLSNEDISDRLSKLDSLTSDRWQELISAMQEAKKAGYQEALVSELIEDIRNAMIGK